MHFSPTREGGARTHTNCHHHHHRRRYVSEFVWWVGRRKRKKVLWWRKKVRKYKTCHGKMRLRFLFLLLDSALIFPLSFFSLSLCTFIARLLSLTSTMHIDEGNFQKSAKAFLKTVRDIFYCCVFRLYSSGWACGLMRWIFVWMW